MASVTFPTSLGGGGQTISDDADPNTGLASGGHRQRFIPALSGAVDMAATSVAKAQDAEDFRDICQQLRDDAETFKNQASTSENNAANSATLSEEWATKLSTPVDGSEYSSKYYANEASDSADLSQDWATSTTEVSGGLKGSKGYAEDAAQNAASVDAQNIVHAPGSGLSNEAGTAVAEDVVTDENDDTPSRLVSNARLSKVVSDYTPLPPGPEELIAGDMLGGFFGEAASSDLFTNQELDFLLGFTEGTSMSDSAWLKFARNGQILYVQKRPMRHSISWDHIYSRGCVYGTNDDGLFPTGTPTNQYRPLYKNGMNFIPRLLTGAASDPIDTTNFDAADSCTYDFGAGSEWNDLIYRVHQDDPFCDDPDHDQYHGGPQVGGNWATYTNGDLGIVSGNGRGTWTQEQASDSTSSRVHRGNFDSVASFSRSAAPSTLSFSGLRLVLALNNS